MKKAAIPAASHVSAVYWMLMLRLLERP